MKLESLTKHTYSMFAFLIIIFSMLPTLQAFSESSELQEYGLLWSFKMNSTVRSVGITRDGSRIAVGSKDDVCLLDNDGKLIWGCKSGEPEIRALAISGNGKWIVAGTGSGTFMATGIFLVFNEHGKVVTQTKERFLRIFSISVSDDAAFIAVHKPWIGFDNIITCFYFNLEEVEIKWQRSIGFGEHASLSSDGNYGATLERE